MSLASTLSADWQKFVSFIQQEEVAAAKFLDNVAAGVQIAITDVENAGQYVAGHLNVINAAFTALNSTSLSKDPTMAKVLADLQTGINDVASLSNALSSGSTAGADNVVTTAVNAINAVNILSGLAAQVASALSAAAANSPTATSAVSQPGGATNA